MDWSGEMIEKLRTLHSEGLSRHEIAAEMGISVNAVAGKAHRLDLRWGRTCATCNGPLVSGQDKFCCNDCRYGYVAPRPWEVKLRALWGNPAYSIRQIADECGIHRSLICKRAKRLKLGPKATDHRGPRKYFNPEQDAIVRRLYPGGTSFDTIRDEVNALGGYKLKTPKQLMKWAKRLKVQRLVKAVRVIKNGMPAVRTTGGPKPILLRQVFQWGFRLGLPLSKRGDVTAVSRAMQKAEPDHPGFVLTTLSSLRMSDAWR